MSKARKALKYSAASTATALLAAGFSRAVTADPGWMQLQGTTRNKVVVIAGVLTASLWAATLL